MEYLSAKRLFEENKALAARIAAYERDLRKHIAFNRALTGRSRERLADAWRVMTAEVKISD